MEQTFNFFQQFGFEFLKIFFGDDADCHNFSFKIMASKLYVLWETFSEGLPKFCEIFIKKM